MVIFALIRTKSIKDITKNKNCTKSTDIQV